MPHQYQRGAQSSSFFKGTNEVAHKIFPFTNTRYDANHVELTYHNQAIPSPYGMQALEQVDMNYPVSFLLGEQTLPINVDPDFSGENCVLTLLSNFLYLICNFAGKRVTAHCGLVDLTSHMGYLRRAFPSIADEDEDYFEHCPEEFDVPKLKAFSRRSHSSRAGMWGHRLRPSSQSWSSGQRQ